MRYANALSKTQHYYFQFVIGRCPPPCCFRMFTASAWWQCRATPTGLQRIRPTRSFEVGMVGERIGSVRSGTTFPGVHRRKGEAKWARWRQENWWLLKSLKRDLGGTEEVDPQQNSLSSTLFYTSVQSVFFLLLTFLNKVSTVIYYYL